MRSIRVLFIMLIILTLLSGCAESSVPGDISASPINTPQDDISTSPTKTPQGNISASPTNTPQGDVSEPTPSQGKIYLYGEIHGVEDILNKEFELWRDYYHNNNMRHLFVELPYYTTEYLNIWMKSDNDGILDALYEDWKGTLAYNILIKKFYQNIKKECPETILHGTDVGHQNNTTGIRYLKYLELNKLKDSEQYLLTKEVIEQGIIYTTNDDHVYRENKMVENFIREFDKLDGEEIMGIYGAAHTGLDALDNTNSVPCMAKQLKERYGDNIYSEDLSWIANEPIRIDTIKINGKEYKASYFGNEGMSWSDAYTSREFWRLENAYDDFKENPKTGYGLPYNNYIMQVEKEQVFVIDYTKKDGSIERKYYRSDGNIWDNLPTTDEFNVD